MTEVFTFFHFDIRFLELGPDLATNKLAIDIRYTVNYNG